MQKRDEYFEKYEEYKQHMDVLLSAPLVDFDIPARILIPLDEAGIRRLRDLVALTKKQLLAVNRMGVLSVTFLEDFLAKQGLSLKNKDRQQPAPGATSHHHPHHH